VSFYIRRAKSGFYSDIAALYFADAGALRYFPSCTAIFQSSDAGGRLKVYRF
jgi:hypothetical protein